MHSVFGPPAPQKRRDRKVTPQLAPSIQICIANYAPGSPASTIIHDAIERVFFARPVSMAKTEFFDVWSSPTIVSSGDASAPVARIVVVELVPEHDFMVRIMHHIHGPPQKQQQQQQQAPRQRTLLVYDSTEYSSAMDLARIQDWCFQFHNVIRVSQQQFKKKAVDLLAMRLYMDIEYLSGLRSSKGEEAARTIPSEIADGGGSSSRSLATIAADGSRLSTIETNEDLARIIHNLTAYGGEVQRVSDAAFLLRQFLDYLQESPQHSRSQHTQRRKAWRHERCDRIFLVAGGVEEILRALAKITQRMTQATQATQVTTAAATAEQTNWAATDTRTRHDLMVVLAELCRGRAEHTKLLVDCGVYGLLVAAVDYEASRLLHATEDTSPEEARTAVITFALIAKIARESENARIELLRCGLTRACRRVAVGTRSNVHSGATERYGVSAILHALTMGARARRRQPRKFLPWALGGATVYATAVLQLVQDPGGLPAQCAVLLLEVIVFALVVYGVDVVVTTAGELQLLVTTLDLLVARREQAIGVLVVRVLALFSGHTPICSLVWQTMDSLLPLLQQMLRSAKCHRSALMLLQTLLQTAHWPELARLAESGIPAVLAARLENRCTQRLAPVLSCLELIGRQACGSIFAADREVDSDVRFAVGLSQLFPYSTTTIDALVAILVEVSRHEEFGFPPLFFWNQGMQTTSLLRDAVRLIGHLVCLADLYPSEFSAQTIGPSDSANSAQSDEDKPQTVTAATNNAIIEQLQKWDVCSILSELTYTLGNVYNVNTILTRLQANKYKH